MLVCLPTEVTEFLFVLLPYRHIWHSNNNNTTTLHVYVAFLIVLYSTVCVIAAKCRADFGPRGSGSERPASLDAGRDRSWSGSDSGG